MIIIIRKLIFKEIIDGRELVILEKYIMYFKKTKNLQALKKQRDMTNFNK